MKRALYLLLIFLLLAGCSEKSITIGSMVDTKIGGHAAAELAKYLSMIYPDKRFEVVDEDTEADIQLMLTDLPNDEESFKIVPQDNKLLIVSPDDRGLLNGVYALLEKLGCGFYISGDRLPEARKWEGYSDWEMEDHPILGDRFLFNWHNFLSGCTGWNLEDWILWIDQANKMRYNGIMLHAYGNNPMFSYDYLGETKATGYMNNSANGRDWGNQHVNDVRRMVGGEIFKGPVYGALPSFAGEERKVEEITRMMHDAFEYAEECGTRVIFALDFDTWMSHPRNIVEQLPGEALFELNDHLTPNPEHPEGYKYYRHQLKELLSKYPQIDELTVWSRSPKNKVNAVLGTIWMAFPYEKFPATWKEAYLRKLRENPRLENDLRAQSMFAFGKLVTALQRAADELNPELAIGYGSWGFDWLEIADVFLPEEIGFRPLDATVAFDTEESSHKLSSVSGTRDIYPVIWAHHDDFAYIGRPYTPYLKLSDMVAERKIKGLGILHWTTHPLDLYFTNTSRQLWHTTANETLETSLNSYVSAIFGQPDEELVNYYYDWLTEGPIFGRETSDHFIDLGSRHWKSKLESWDTLIIDANSRLQDLSTVPELDRNAYWEYQKGMEQFYISFFENQNAFDTAYKLTENGKIGEAMGLMRGANPDITIEKFVVALQNIAYTPGEEALVLSLNTRWKTDFINLNQRLGMEDVRIRFSPTRHDPLAQVPGTNTYYIDEIGNWWICFWSHELPGEKFSESDGQATMVVDHDLSLQLTTMHGQDLPPGEFTLILDAELEGDASVVILENDSVIASSHLKAGEQSEPLSFSGKGGDIVLAIESEGSMRLFGFEIKPLNQYQ